MSEKKIRTIIVQIIFVFYFLCALYIPCLQASSLDVSKYVILDVESVISNSISFKSFKSEWDRENNKYQKEIEFYETEILDLNKKIQQETEKAHSSEVRNLKQKLGNLEIKIQKLVHKRKIHLNDSFAEAVDKIKVVIFNLVQEYSLNNNVIMVLPKSQTIYSSDSIDITKAILENLDKDLPKINVKLK